MKKILWDKVLLTEINGQKRKEERGTKIGFKNFVLQNSFHSRFLWEFWQWTSLHTGESRH